VSPKEIDIADSRVVIIRALHESVVSFAKIVFGGTAWFPTTVVVADCKCDACPVNAEPNASCTGLKRSTRASDKSAMLNNVIESVCDFI